MLATKLLLTLLTLIISVTAQQNTGWRFARPFSRFPNRIIPRPPWPYTPKPVQTAATTLPTAIITPTPTPQVQVTTNAKVNIVPSTRSPVIPSNNSPLQRFWRPKPWFQPTSTFRPNRVIVYPSRAPNTPKPQMFYVYPEKNKPSSQEPALVHESEIIPQPVLSPRPANLPQSVSASQTNADIAVSTTAVNVIYPEVTSKPSNIEVEPIQQPWNTRPNVPARLPQNIRPAQSTYQPKPDVPQSSDQPKLEVSQPVVQPAAQPQPEIPQVIVEPSVQPQAEITQPAVQLPPETYGNVAEQSSAQSTAQPQIETLLPAVQPSPEIPQVAQQLPAQPTAQPAAQPIAPPKPEIPELAVQPSVEPSLQIPQSAAQIPSQPPAVVLQPTALPSPKPVPEIPQPSLQPSLPVQPEIPQPAEQASIQPQPEIAQPELQPFTQPKSITLNQENPRFLIQKPWSKPIGGFITKPQLGSNLPWIPTSAKPLIAKPLNQPGIIFNPTPAPRMPAGSEQLTGLMDYQCAQPNGYFPVPNECDNFVECKNYVAMQVECPDGLHFNPNTVWPEYPCDYPSVVRCAANLEIQPPHPSASCPRQNGYFPSMAGDCGKYIICQEGKATEMTCPSGLGFNYEKSICDWPADVPSCNPNVFKGFSCPAPDVDEYGKPSDAIFKYRFNKSCKNYIACQRGSPRLLSCDHGFSYDDLSQSCIDSEFVTDCI